MSARVRTFAAHRYASHLRPSHLLQLLYIYFFSHSCRSSQNRRRLSSLSRTELTVHLETPRSCSLTKLSRPRSTVLDSVLERKRPSSLMYVFFPKENGLWERGKKDERPRPLYVCIPIDIPQSPYSTNSSLLLFSIVRCITLLVHTGPELWRARNREGDPSLRRYPGLW